MNKPAAAPTSKLTSNTGAAGAKKDFAIPIVFPDYLIAVTVSKRKINFIPGVTWDDFEWKGVDAKLPDLGHAGVMLVNGSTGLTRYYEYGRYDPKALGLTRTLKLVDAKIGKEGLDWASLKRPLQQISKGAGHGGRIEAVVIAAAGAFDGMDKYAESRMGENRNPKRAPYNITSNSCVHFTKDTVEAGGISTPWMVDPRPNSYIGEFQSSFPDLRYDPKTQKLTIEGIGDF